MKTNRIQRMAAIAGLVILALQLGACGKKSPLTIPAETTENAK